MAPVKNKKSTRKRSLSKSKARRYREPSLPSTLPSAFLPSTPSASLSLANASDLASTEIADQLHSAAIHLLRRLRVRDRESGIGPAQLSALSVLVFGGPRSLGELADAEQVRPPTMSRIVAGLQRAKLVRRHETDDGRRVRLEATPAGVSLMWEGRKRRVQSLAAALSSLPEDERQRLREAAALLKRILKTL